MENLTITTDGVATAELIMRLLRVMSIFNKEVKTNYRDIYVLVTYAEPEKPSTIYDGGVARLTDKDVACMESYGWVHRN